MNRRGFIGYDWFKLIVAVILALLLLVPGLRNDTLAVTAPPAATSAAATQAPVAVASTAAPASAPTEAATSVPSEVATSAPTEAATATAGDAADTTATSADAAQPTTGTVNAPRFLKPPMPLIAGSTQFAGLGTPGSQVEVIIDNSVVGRASVGADGMWSLPVQLVEGDHEVIVRALDANGAAIAESSGTLINVAPASSAAPTSAPPAEQTPTVAPTAPPAEQPTTDATSAPGAAPAITGPLDGAQIPAGSFSLTGTGAPGAQIEVLDSDKVIGTVTADANGAWSLPISASDGTAAYSVRPVGSQEVSAKPIRVTIGAGEQAANTALSIGGKAWVTRENGRSLRLRAGAGLNSRVLTSLPVGTEVTLLEGPQTLDGYSWWRVQTLAGREGWVAGEELVTQPD